MHKSADTTAPNDDDTKRGVTVSEGNKTESVPALRKLKRDIKEATEDKHKNTEVSKTQKTKRRSS